MGDRSTGNDVKRSDRGFGHRSRGKPVGPGCRQLWSGELLEIDRHAMPIPNPFMMQPMSIFGFARITSLVSGVLALAAIVAAQAAPSDPARFVASIYADGREGVFGRSGLTVRGAGNGFRSALTALWAKCDARAHDTDDELGAVDFDVATNSQGLEVKRFTVKTLSRDASHASVVARLTPDNWVRKSERENEIRYDLVWERGRWTIDDIHSVIEPNAWSLRAILTQYLAR